MHWYSSLSLSLIVNHHQMRTFLPDFNKPIFFNSLTISFGVIGIILPPTIYILTRVYTYSQLYYIFLSSIYTSRFDNNLYLLLFWGLVYILSVEQLHVSEYLETSTPTPPYFVSAILSFIVLNWPSVCETNNIL